MLFLDESPKLNETDIAIYRFILNNLEITSFMNVRELAERTHTSTASIIRFCKKFQCAGFSDFKVKLRLYIDKAESLNETADLDESLIINFMQRTTEKIYQQKIAEVAKLLASKELIFFDWHRLLKSYRRIRCLIFFKYFQHVRKHPKPFTKSSQLYHS